MELFKNFISTSGTTILSYILVALAGYLGIAVKNLYTKYINNKTKKEVVETCVKAIEQIYKGCQGSEKLQKAIEATTNMLTTRGISIDETEMRLLIESVVAEFNDAFNKESKAIESTNK